MPALSYTNNLGKRVDNGGRNFSIIFGIIAFVAVAICLFWGIFLPKYRKKHPRRPSPTRYNTHSQPQALLRGLRRYDPRTQTPFPNTPPPGDSISLPSLIPRNRSAPDLSSTNQSDGLFSPARDRLPTRRGFPVHGNPKTSSTEYPPPFGSGTDYILPVPAPIPLCPKSAGRAPTLARQLKQFPIPRSASAETGKLAHPKKLFNDLDQRYSKTTTITSLGTPSPIPLNTQRQTELVRGYVQDVPLTELIDPHTHPSQPRPSLRNGSPAMNRSETQTSSRSDSEKRARLGRAGTVTRPKTPVAEMRDLYDGRPQVAVAKGETSSKSGTTSSVEYPTDSTLSSYVRSGTPPTSPEQTSKSAGSTARFLGKDDDKGRNTITTTLNIAFNRHSLSSGVLPASDRLAPMDTIHEGRKDETRNGVFRSSRGLTRPRPAQLNLASVAESPAVKKRAHRHSMSSLGSMLMPLVKSKRPSIQASSVYSRDTRGVSIVRSPVSPAFCASASGDVDKEEGTIGPLGRKASSLESLKCKIDNWDLHTADLDFPTSPSSALKRALSDLGPRSPTFPNPSTASLHMAGEPPLASTERSVPRICIGRPSDDIFRDPSPNIETGMVLKRVLDMEMEASTADLTRSPNKAPAPGGADWI